MGLTLRLIGIVCLFCAASFSEGVSSSLSTPLPASIAPNGPNIVAGQSVALERGVYEVVVYSNTAVADPFCDVALSMTFKRPDASRVTVDGFYDGVSDRQSAYKARAYCDQTGSWSWATSSTLPDIDGRTGAFTVAASELPGKLRKHPRDPRQFAYDHGGWFLHIGDTGYRYVVDSEPEWQAYIDQAAATGATKIRTWFCRSRSGVAGLFTEDRTGLQLPYWQEIDRRIQYALNRHPKIILQLIPYGEDSGELLRYAQGERISRFVARYAQARWSAFPNVIWCISNDRRIAGEGTPVKEENVPASVIDGIARDMAAREPWGTLLTNHQARHTGYAFASAAWSDITTLEDLDQVDGALLLEYREKSDDPVVLDEDRYELYRPPAHPRYFFRRLMWASLLSGGSATYGGAQTYVPFNQRDCGVRGYYDLKKEGILSGGADDFVHIHTFFAQAGLDLVGMQPADHLAACGPNVAKVIADARTLIVYLPNPGGGAAEKADVSAENAACRLRFPAGEWSLRWFNPRAGTWLRCDTPVMSSGQDPQACNAPFTGDAVLLATLTSGEEAAPQNP